MGGGGGGGGDLTTVLESLQEHYFMVNISHVS